MKNVLLDWSDFRIKLWSLQSQNFNLVRYFLKGFILLSCHTAFHFFYKSVICAFLELCLLYSLAQIWITSLPINRTTFLTSLQKPKQQQTNVFTSVWLMLVTRLQWKHVLEIVWMQMFVCEMPFKRQNIMHFVLELC